MSSASPRDVQPPGTGGAARPPTINDVAGLAGVSKSVVSRVLTGADGVSAASREAVLAAASRVGYRPNRAARSLVQRRSYHVGVVVSDLHNVFFAEILDGIDRVATAHGYRMLITTGNRDRDAERQALEALLELRADGVILAGVVLAEAALRPARRAVPLALVSSALRPPNIDTVTDDDQRGAQLAVRHLASLGHRRIAMIDGGAGAGAAERRQGYEAAMRALGLGDQVLVTPGDFTEEGGYQGARRLLACEPAPTAIFASNDLAALGALDAIDEAGLRVPQGISLVGYDNTSLAQLRHISLTTVHQPRREIGEMAMKALLHRIEQPSARARRVLLEPTLVARQTTGPPPPEPPRRRVVVSRG